VAALGEDEEKNAIGGLLLASLVVMFASCEHVSHGTGLFGLVWSIISLVFAAITYFMISTKRAGPGLKKAMSCIMLLMWMAAMFVLTYAGPFQTTGNGYFGTLAAFFLSVSLFQQEVTGSQTPLTKKLRASFASSKSLPVQTQAMPSGTPPA